MQEHNGGSCVRNVLSLIGPGILRRKRIKFFRAHFLAVRLVFGCLHGNFIRHGTGHQDESLEPPLHSTQDRAGHRVIAVADIGNAFRVNISASLQQVNAATHVDYLLHQVSDVLFV